MAAPDLPAGDAMLHPKCADRGVAVRECEPIGRQLMTKTRGVKINAPASGFCPIDPRAKMGNCEGIAVHLLRIVGGVDGMKIQTERAGNQLLHLLKVGTEFREVSCFPWKIPGGETPASRSA